MSKEEMILRHFIEKAKDLCNSRYCKSLTETNLSVKIQWKGGKASSQRTGPDEEEIKAFILTLRFFCQDNEPTSLRNMQKMIESLDIDAQFMDDFLSIRNSLNHFLDNIDLVPIITISDQTSPMSRGQTPSNREIFDAFMYGKYAHLTKHEVVESWEKLVAGPSMRAKFDQILREFVSHIAALSGVCSDILAAQKSKKSSSP